MRLDWHLDGGYEDVGGVEALREAVEEAVTVLPREHLRQLEAFLMRDEDPRGKALGIWRQDHMGVAIELYLQPHVTPLLPLPASVRAFALRLHLAYTIFHEVGHHVTRFLNRRATPPRKAALVEQKIERWADDYAEKRLGRMVEMWLRPGGRADTADGRRALAAALRSLRLDALVSLPGTDGTGKEAKEGTKEVAPAS
jgi:hypothetical protein